MFIEFGAGNDDPPIVDGGFDTECGVIFENEVPRMFILFIDDIKALKYLSLFKSSDRMCGMPVPPSPMKAAATC